MPPFISNRAAEAATIPFGYQPWLVELSCLIALAGAYAALRTIWQADQTDTYRDRLLVAAAALAMGVSTWSMHFLGMLAIDGPFDVSFQPQLTALSLLPAIIASALAMRVIVRRRAGLPGLLLGGVTMGGGISAMHYIGMAAITVDAEMRYDAPTLILSVLAACLLSTCALTIIRRARARPSTQFRILAISALCLGGAVSAMHYAGMSAMQLYATGGPASIPGGWNERTLAMLVTLGTALVLVAVVGATAIDRKTFAIRAHIRGHSRNVLAAIEGLTEGFIVFDERHRAVVWNSQAQQISTAVNTALKPGARYEDLLAQLAHEPCQSIDVSSVRHNSRQQFECELSDGSCIQVTQTATAAGYLVVSFTDITEHKRGKERLHAFFDQAPYPFLAVNRENTIVSINRACLDTFGYEAHEIIGRSCRVLVPADQQEAMLRRVEHCFDVRVEGSVPTDVEPRGVRSNGTVFPVEVSYGVLDFDREPLVVFGVRDLSQRRQLEAKLLKSQKMELVGQLSGGLAHDFNNLLTVVMGNLQLLEADIDPNSQGTEQIRDAIEATKRGSDLTKRLLAFSRRQLLAPRPICINELVTDLIPLLRNSMTAEIEIMTKLPADLWTVEVDPSQLESALLNLAINSRDAMPEGGKIVIETQNVVFDADFSTHRAEVAPGAYVMVTVSDTGTGMSQDVLNQAFEPFFSTKASGRGSGLGLSTVYGFVKQSKGHIGIYSEPGMGTSVKVYLPKTELHAESSASATYSHKLIPSGDERILLVDDDAAVRRTVAQLLESLGYDVVDVGTASEAIERFEQTECFDLLLTDIVMPGGMSGLDLARKIRKLDQSIKILLTSGYTDTALFARGVLGPDEYVLNKPYRRSELAQKIRSMLDGEVVARPPAIAEQACSNAERP